MLRLQRSLSDILNLVFRDLDDPERLWPWPMLLTVGTLLLLLLGALVYLA